ncbi:MAG: hypothetical protein ACLPX7_19160, partial [Xanthobacteraceae bacterium]
FGDKDKVIYEAALSAASEFPDEVTQLALELSCRQPEPAHVIQRREEERAREKKRREEWAKQNPDKVRQRMAVPTFLGSYRDGPLRTPAADGPSRAISDGFRAAVMQTQTLNGLIVARPDVAREVLLAVCIDEPKRSDPHGNDRLSLDRLGLADWRMPDRDWHHHELGSLFTDVLSLCWKHLQGDVEKDAVLREAFVDILAVLCARQVPEALHLRAKVGEVLSIG